MLAQHPNGPKPRQGPKRKTRVGGSNSGRLNNGSRGNDVLTSISLSANSESGKVLMNRPFGPSSFGGTRLNAESKLWARWKPRSLKVTVMGAGASTTYGSVLVGWVADPTYNIRKGPMSINLVGAMKPHIQVKLNSTGVMIIPPQASRLWYDVESSMEENNSHGSLVMVTGSDCGGWTGALSITISLDWMIDFNGQEIPYVSQPDSVDIHPDSGWYDIHTTSDGSWNAGRLTFKMHAGGEMVPFSSAIAGVVYGPESGVTVPYVKEDLSVGRASFFSLIQGYFQPGLVLHATYADAIAYIQSGDPTKILPYFGGAQNVTPSVPRFKPVTSVGYNPMEDRMSALEINVSKILKMLELGVAQKSIDVPREELVKLGLPNQDEFSPENSTGFRIDEEDSYSRISSPINDEGD